MNRKSFPTSSLINDFKDKSRRQTQTEFIFGEQETFRHCILIVFFSCTRVHFEFGLTDIFWTKYVNTLFLEAVISVLGPPVLRSVTNQIKNTYGINSNYQLCTINPQILCLFVISDLNRPDTSCLVKAFFIEWIPVVVSSLACFRRCFRLLTYV